VEFVGYGGGRDMSGTYLQWASVGYIHLLVDIRGRASGWGGGGTSDPQGTGPSAAGFMARGIEHPESYYYRRVFTDAVRAVQVVRTISRVDRAKVSVARISQGGGISLAVAGLVNDLFAVTPDVTFCATSNVRWTSVNEARTQRSADTSRSTVGRPEEPLTL
jgi:cephalosporin-C deacetylase